MIGRSRGFSATMQALQLLAPNQLEHCVLPTPQPGPHQVLVKTLATTICTSDLHDISRNPFGITLPRVLGHEAAGIVVASGAQVSSVDIGALVAIHPVVNCGECQECRRGFTHHCQQLGHLGFDRDGCFAEYIVQREDRVRVLPPNVSAHVGTLLEPLCVCLQAVARAGDLTQKTVLVVGDGPFGIIIARMALRWGEGHSRRSRGVSIETGCHRNRTALEFSRRVPARGARASRHGWSGCCHTGCQ